MATKRIGNITLNYTVPEAQTQVYNAIGRTAGAQATNQQEANQNNGGDNFFAKRGRSIENAIGTTLVTPIAWANEGVENRRIERDRKDARRSMNDIAKKYGYNSWSDWQDANAAARESGDTEAIKRFDAQLKEFQAQANKNANKATEQADKYNDYRQNDYISKKINQDNTKFLGSAINTLSTAADLTGITATPGLNAAQGAIEGFADELEQNGGTIDSPLSNVVYGGGNWSAKNWDNFDLGRAAQNAAIGATTGAVTGALNKGISNSLAKRAAAKGLTNTAAKTGLGQAIKQGAKTIAGGAARGALSGAVGGATGAGLQSALNGVEFGQGVQNALQGAVQGAQQGAVTGGTMAAANMAISKTPGLGKFYNELQSAKQNWDQSGRNFDERLTNTLTSGDSAVGDWIMNKRQSNILGAAGNLGNRVQFVDDEFELESIPGMSKNLQKYLDNMPRTPEYMEKEIEHARQYVDEYNNAADKTKTNFGYLSESPDGAKMVEAMRELAANGDAIMAEIGGNTQQAPTTAKGWLKKAGQRVVEDMNNKGIGLSIQDVNDEQVSTNPADYQARNYLEAKLVDELKNANNNYSDDIKNMYVNRNDMLGYTDDGSEPITVEEALGGTVRRQPTPQATPQATSAWDRVAQEAGYRNYDEVLQRYAEANPNAEINPRGMAGQVLTWMDQNPNTEAPTTAAGWAKRAGQRAVEGINKRGIGLSIQDVSAEEPQRQLYNTQGAMTESENPSTQLYRMLSGEPASPTDAITNADYGESDLANRTKRGMIARALERAGNTLEGAQANLTRATTKDLGIESAGKSIENVRKKTGITNLETQAAFAKELTGGDNSLMDNVQRIALTESADGRPYTVDTSDIAADVEAIVDKYADTNTFGSQSKRNQFISNLRRDISNYDTDVLSIANRMKANAADYRGKGVTDPTPADAAKAKIYTEVANKLEDLSYSAIPQENVDAMFDKTISEMNNRATQAKANGNNKVAKAYTKTAQILDNEPRTVKAFRSFKKDFVDVSKIDRLTSRAENGAAAQMGRSFGTGIKRLTGTLLQRPINATLAKVGGGVNWTADKIDGGGTVVNPSVASPTELANMTANYNPSTQLYNAIGRTEGLTNAEQANTAKYLVDAAQEAEVVPSMEMPVSEQTATIAESPTYGSTQLYNTVAGIPSATTQTTSTGTMGYFEPTGDYWTDVLARAISSAIDANDVDAFASLYDMYQDAIAQTSKQSSEKDYTNPTNWSSSDRNKLLTAQNGLDQISQLEQAYKDATGEGGSNAIQGWLRSRASDISGGNLDPSASNYNALTDSVGLAIIKNLINLGVTTEDAERYKKYIPAITDTKEQAAEKLATLRSIYQNQINNLYSVYGV